MTGKSTGNRTDGVQRRGHDRHIGQVLAQLRDSLWRPEIGDDRCKHKQSVGTDPRITGKDK